jgi:GNAT superfamily N-acetyltransferase
MTLPSLTAPAPLSEKRDTLAFDCGEAVLDEWLKKKAMKNQNNGASRCFVTCAPAQRVVGYYSLSAGAVSRDDAPKAARRNRPDPIPVLLLGRLAVDRTYHNQGIGKALLRDAVLRALHIAEDAGIVALLVHAKSEQARRFYLSRGFLDSPLQPTTLLLMLETARQAL